MVHYLAIPFIENVRKTYLVMAKMDLPIHLYDYMDASLFVYNVDLNIARAFWEWWSPRANTLHTAIGEMPILFVEYVLSNESPIYEKFFKRLFL